MIRTTLLTFILLFATNAWGQQKLRTDFRHNHLIDHAPAEAKAPHRAMNTTGSNGLGIYSHSANGTVPSIGEPTIPVILVAYPDMDFMEDNNEEKMWRWLNEKGYHDEPHAVGSVTDYFRENSYGMFVPHFEIVDKVTVSQPFAYYGARTANANDAHARDLVKEAIDLAMSHGVNFSRFATDDNIPIVSIIHAGPGEHEDLGYYFDDPDCDNFIWAHYSTIYYNKSNLGFTSYIISNETMRDFDENKGIPVYEYKTGAGTFCHEFCHALGLTDNYDVDGNSNGSGETPGLWDIMDYQFMLNGFRPAELSAYQRCCLGWLEIPELPTDQNSHITLLPLDESNATGATPDAARAFRITNPYNEREYFILENHQPATWYVDSYYNQRMMGTGMLIWHIDYDASAWSSNRVNNKADHQRIAVVCADGTWQSISYFSNDVYGDLFPGYQNVKHFDNTIANFYTSELATKITNIEEQTDGTITFVVNSTTTSIDAAPMQNVQKSCFDLYGRRGNGHYPVRIESGRKYIK